ncbi:MAG: alpha/beta hydrolase [Polyangiaceae bacterium]|nr:alpha/beta hydrolase [Polyangiaceae bacterium]
MAPLKYERKSINSFDGTRLALYSVGDRDLPTMVLANGIGGDVEIWRNLVNHYLGRYRIVTWDYRGLHGSGPAPKIKSYRMSHHAEDLATILALEEIEDPHLVAWSMGVQVVMEFHRRHTDLAASFVALNGAPGQTLDSVYGSRLPGRMLRPVLRAAMRGNTKVGSLGGLLSDPDFLAIASKLLRRLGMTSEDIELAAFRQLLAHWLDNDLRVYSAMLRSMGEHDVDDILPRLQTPTLVIGGEMDVLTPPELSQKMVNKLPNGELHILKGASHFGLIERPGKLVERMDEFYWSLRDTAAARSVQLSGGDSSFAG